MKTSPALSSQNLTSQSRFSLVGMNEMLVGSTSRWISDMRPMWTNPVKKMRVSGVP